MKNIKIISFFMFLFILTYQTVLADNSKTYEIMKKVEDRDRGDNMISNMEMILTDKWDRQRVKKLKAFSKDKGDDRYSIKYFIYPADIKDTALLTYDYDEADKDDDQWLYLPALKKIKRIASKDKSSSFMGTDFNYSDMTIRNVEDYNYRFVKEAIIKGVKTWVIESIPCTQEIIDERGYTKSLHFIRQDNYVGILAVHWVKKSKKIKYFEVKKLELIDGIWVNVAMQMITKQGKKILHKTLIKQTDVKFNQDLTHDFFSVRQLEKGF